MVIVMDVYYSRNNYSHYKFSLTRCFQLQGLLIFQPFSGFNIWFSGAFRGFKMGTLARNGLNQALNM